MSYNQKSSIRSKSFGIGKPSAGELVQNPKFIARAVVNAKDVIGNLPIVGGERNLQDAMDSGEPAVDWKDLVTIVTTPKKLRPDAEYREDGM